jgi:maleate isomerase
MMDLRAEWLAKRKVDIITIGGCPMFRMMGAGSDLKIIDRIEEKFGIPVTTNQTVAVEAFKKLNAKKIVVASPYFEHQDKQVKQFLETSGFEVVNIKGLSAEIEVIHTLPPETSYEHGKKVFYETPEADAMYIPCAHFAVPYLQQLEDDIQVPVVTSTTAMLWYCFNLLNIHASIKGEGTLLASLAR